MIYTLTLDGPRPPAERRRKLAEVAFVLSRAGTRTVLVDWAADGLPGWEDVDPVRIVGRAAYGAALDDALAAVGTVGWEPAGPGDPERDRAVYRIAASLGMPAVTRRVVLACLDPAGYVDRYPDDYGEPDLPLAALYSALGEASLLIGVDWKSTRTEAATALGGLLVVPDARERLADAVPGYPDLLRRCDAGDRADRDDGPAPPVGDPLGGDGQQLEGLVADEVAALAAAVRVVLLRLSNGDTPGYLVCRADRAAQWLELTGDAALPFERVSPERR